MCPDPKVLSIYIDGELPSPWKEKLEAHLAACPKCKERLGNYKHMQDLFKRGVSHIPEAQRRTIVERGESENNSAEPEVYETELLEKSKERVWKRLASRQRYNTSGFVRKGGSIRSYSIWRRKLSIPVPIAAAAALLVLFGTMFFMQNSNTAVNNHVTEFPTSFIEEIPSDFLPSNVSYNDISSVLPYINSDGSDLIIIQLPTQRNFSRTGEPEIIRAADFNGNEYLDSSSSRRQP